MTSFFIKIFPYSKRISLIFSFNSKLNVLEFKIILKEKKKIENFGSHWNLVFFNIKKNSSAKPIKYKAK